MGKSEDGKWGLSGDFGREGKSGVRVRVEMGI